MGGGGKRTHIKQPHGTCAAVAGLGSQVRRRGAVCTPSGRKHAPNPTPAHGQHAPMRAMLYSSATAMAESSGEAGASVLVNVKLTATGFSRRCRNTRWTPVENREVMLQHRDCHHRDICSWEAQVMGSSPDGPGGARKGVGGGAW